MGTFLVILVVLVVFYGATALAVEAVKAHFRKLSYEKERGHLYYGILLALIALGFYIVGISMLTAVLSDGQTAALVITLILMGCAYASVRHYQSTKAQLLLHIGATAALGLSGLLVLILVF